VSGAARDIEEFGKSYSSLLLRCTDDNTSKNIKHDPTARGRSGDIFGRWSWTWNVQASIRKLTEGLTLGACPSFLRYAGRNLRKNSSATHMAFRGEVQGGLDCRTCGSELVETACDKYRFLHRNSREPRKHAAEIQPSCDFLSTCDSIVIQ
jgi:hypothetical protein